MQLIKSCSRDGRFDIPGDRKLWNLIVDDLLANAKHLAPTLHWVNLDGGMSDQVATQEALEIYKSDSYWKRFNSLNAMLDPIVGCTGMQWAPPEEISKYQKWLAYSSKSLSTEQ